MTWLLVGIFTIILVELFLRLPLLGAAQNVFHTGQRATRTLSKRNASDHWKEKACKSYALQMFKNSFVLVGGLALIGIVGAVLAVGVEKLLPGTNTTLASWEGLLFSFFIASIYLALRLRVVS